MKVETFLWYLFTLVSLGPEPISVFKNRTRNLVLQIVEGFSKIKIYPFRGHHIPCYEVIKTKNWMFLYFLFFFFRHKKIRIESYFNFLVWLEFEASFFFVISSRQSTTRLFVNNQCKNCIIFVYFCVKKKKWSGTTDANQTILHSLFLTKFCYLHRRNVTTYYLMIMSEIQTKNLGTK